MIGQYRLLSVFIHAPNKGFWACLGDLTVSMPRRPETRVLCNKSMLKNGK